MTTHILLGAGGAIADVLSRELLARQQTVKLVARRGPVRADLLDRESVQHVVEDGSTVHLLAGLPYDLRVWREQWPRIMHNVLEACAAHGARLIFFDNVYMYGRVQGPMTEETPVRPSSRKGEVRAAIAAELLEAAKRGRVRACIARAADFYGPGVANGIPNQLVFIPLSNGKTAQWLVNADVPHSFTYTPDCGRALPLLAAADDVWGEVWHMPTAPSPPTGRQFVELAASALGVPPHLRVLRPWMLRMAGVFNRTIGEIGEMLYQYEAPYLFDSSKFERRFEFTPAPYAEGIAATASPLTSGTSRSSGT
ncbi:MAG TPA: NAD-dependent epimerase/dehydratase family protein [Thermoanaerobaculia bacterium]|nr:NAD-dependent epimerase/dehydratase family protein [Thermoanaerobaculia bacterium]